MKAEFQDGLYLLDKRPGYTSFAEIREFANRFGFRKVGHAGTLDKFATGLLLLGTGKFSKVLTYLQGLPKVYQFTVDFSKLSDTLDLEGEVLQRFDVDFNPLDLAKLIKTFRGQISQVPPLYSALKYKGRRLSDISRDNKQKGIIANQELDLLKKRTITLYNIRLLSKVSDNEASFLARCSSGTYIRSLARDIGAEMDIGGVTIALRRLRIGGYSVKKAFSMSSPIGVIPQPVNEWQLGRSANRVVVAEMAAKFIAGGIIPKVFEHFEQGKDLTDIVYIYNRDKQLLAIGKMAERIEQTSPGIVVVKDQPLVYPNYNNIRMSSQKQTPAWERQGVDMRQTATECQNNLGIKTAGGGLTLPFNGKIAKMKVLI